MLLHNMKNIRHQNQDPKKTKRMHFYYVVTQGKEAPRIPSEQSFYQAICEDPNRSRRLLKRTAQDFKDPPMSTKQARREKTLMTVSPPSTLETPQSSPEAVPTNHDLPSDHEVSLQSPSDPKTSLHSGMPSTVQSSPLDQDETFQSAFDMLVVAWKYVSNYKVSH